MAIVFRDLIPDELTIFQQVMEYWLTKEHAKTFLQAHHFLVGEGRWRELFLTNESTTTLLKENDISPYTVGLGFGEFRGKWLLLSLSGASFISKLATKRASVSHEGEQAFLFKKDILCKSITSIDKSLQPEDKLLIFNQEEDFLGIGKLVLSLLELRLKENRNKVGIQNTIDLGWYLRKGK